MKVANGVEVLELEMNFGGNRMVIHPTLLWDQNSVILVDTGIPGQLNEIRAAMDKVGVSFDDLQTVILTHQDIDHIGSLPEILKASDRKIQVLAHEADKPYIEGQKPLIKMSPERAAQLGTIPQADVDRTIADGEVLPYCGGITVIYTPGHTPGHVSLYLNESKVLITGDAMVSRDGKLLGPNPQNTPNMEQATESLKKFTQYDVDTVICYHGGLVTENANEQLAELVRG